MVSVGLFMIFHIEGHAKKIYGEKAIPHFSKKISKRSSGFKNKIGLLMLECVWIIHEFTNHLMS